MATRRLNKAFVFIISISILVFVAESFLVLHKSQHFSEGKFYPRDAITYLKSTTISGNVFSTYGWGGYLIWKYPGSKVFIDGRMPSWRWEKENLGESKYVMKDYSLILREPSFYEKQFDKYNITMVLWPVQRDVEETSKILITISNYIATKTGYEESSYNFLSQIEEDGWEEVYKDSVAVIYRKPDSL